MSTEAIEESRDKKIASITRDKSLKRDDVRYKRNKLISVNLIIFVILNYLFSCILNDKLILLHKIIKYDVSRSILENVGWVFVILSSLYILFHLLIQIDDKKEFEKRERSYY